MGPCTDRLYAVLPAGVDTNTIGYQFINYHFFTLLNDNAAACLLCLKIETSLIAIDFS